MEAPKSIQNRIHRVENSTGIKAGSKLDFVRNLSFCQEYLSQKKGETRLEAPSNRELAEHKGHRKSSSNNFSFGNPLIVKSSKTIHIRSITSCKESFDNLSSMAESTSF